MWSCGGFPVDCDDFWSGFEVSVQTIGRARTRHGREAEVVSVEDHRTRGPRSEETTGTMKTDMQRAGPMVHTMKVCAGHRRSVRGF